MNFEWDEDKRRINIAKHEIDFLDARQLFDGRPTFNTVDAHDDEDRQWTIGHVGGRYIIVVWTLRGDAIRIISARKATRTEVSRLLTSRW